MLLKASSIRELQYRMLSKMEVFYFAVIQLKKPLVRRVSIHVWTSEGKGALDSRDNFKSSRVSRVAERKIELCLPNRLNTGSTPDNSLDCPRTITSHVVTIKLGNEVNNKIGNPMIQCILRSISQNDKPLTPDNLDTRFRRQCPT